MAEIRDGVFGYVSGTVTKEFNYSKGRALEVEVKGDDRQKYPDKWTVWGDLPAAVGDRVKVAGWLSTKAESYEKQDGSTGVASRRSVNSPKLDGHEPAAGSAPAGDTWHTGDTTPF